jgi:DNA-directed RNA polymerase subunit RPC12/RpoP
MKKISSRPCATCGKDTFHEYLKCMDCGTIFQQPSQYGDVVRRMVKKYGYNKTIEKINSVDFKNWTHKHNEGELFHTGGMTHLTREGRATRRTGRFTMQKSKHTT